MSNNIIPLRTKSTPAQPPFNYGAAAYKKTPRVEQPVAQKPIDEQNEKQVKGIDIEEKESTETTPSHTNAKKTIVIRKEINEKNIIGLKPFLRKKDKEKKDDEKVVSSKVSTDTETHTQNDKDILKSAKFDNNTLKTAKYERKRSDKKDDKVIVQQKKEDIVAEKKPIIPKVPDTPQQISNDSANVVPPLDLKSEEKASTDHHKEKRKNKRKLSQENEEPTQGVEELEQQPQDDEEVWNEVEKSGKTKKVNIKKEKEKKEKQIKREEERKRKEEEAKKKKEEEERIKREREEEERKQREEEMKRKREEEERIKREEEERKRKEEEERKKKEEEERVKREKEEEERKRKEEEESKNIYVRKMQDSKNEGGKPYNLSQMESYRKCAVKLPEEVRNRFNLIYHETVERIETIKTKNKKEQRPVPLFSQMLDEEQRKVSKMLTILNQLSKETDLDAAAESLAFYLKTEDDIKLFITHFIKRCVNESKFCKLYVQFIVALRRNATLTRTIPQSASVMNAELLEKAYDYFHKLPEPKPIEEGMSPQEIEQLKEAEAIEQVEYRGTVNLIAHLFEIGLVNERLPLTCLQELSKDINETKIDAYITLCSKVGEQLMACDTSSPTYSEIIEVFNKAKDLQNHPKLSKRIRLLLMNIVQKMESGWTISPFLSLQSTPMPPTPNLSSTTPSISQTPSDSHSSGNQRSVSKGKDGLSKPKPHKKYSEK